MKTQREDGRKQMNIWEEGKEKKERDHGGLGGSVS